LEKFYKSYDDKDVRKKQWFVGPILNSKGDTIVYNGKKAIITPKISKPEDESNGNNFDGARFVKFEIEPGIAHHANNDFPVYRYADILLMRAEALMRLNGGAATDEAVKLANQVHKRTGLDDYTTATLDLNELLKERGRELAWEGHRRQDLIRFGKFGDPWEFKNPSSSYRTLFPIPDWVREAAPGVYTQNPGYGE
jgi:hypothetical protein